MVGCTRCRCSQRHRLCEASSRMMGGNAPWHTNTLPQPNRPTTQKACARQPSLRGLRPKRSAKSGSLRETGEGSRNAGEVARMAAEAARDRTEAARHATVAAVRATADALQLTVEQMKLVEEMRRALRDVRDPARARSQPGIACAGTLLPRLLAASRLLRSPQCASGPSRVSSSQRSAGSTTLAAGSWPAVPARSRGKTVHRRSRRDPGRRGQAHEFRDAIFVKLDLRS